MKRTATPGRRWLVVLAVVVSVGLGGAIWQGAIGQDRAPGDEKAAIAQAKGLSRAFRAAAKSVLPTVVKITTRTKPPVVKRSGGERLRDNPFKGTPFEDFFEDDVPGFRFYGRNPPFGYRTPVRQGLGSGVIIDPSGVIVTNYHVVDGADNVLIELSDGRQFPATDIRTDKRTELAVLRIKANESLPAARLGDSSKMDIGDWVLAIGNPFSWENTVSAGIISGKDRPLRRSSRESMWTDFLQTDAAINPGNSGGPLVNLEGEVVGINTAISTSTGAFQGVGFAIPANLVKWVSRQLIDRGTVQRAYLGVQIGEIEGPLAGKFGVKPNGGVLVTEVFQDSPAAAAGFQEGDVIVAFAGHPVRSPRQLQEAVERSSAGSKQRAEILRNGKPQTLQVSVKSIPEDYGLASRRPPLSRGTPDDSSGFTSDELGLEVSNLSDQLAERLGYEGFSGVLITEVDPGGIAASAELSEGMLIREVEKVPVKSVADFEAALKGKSLKEGVLLKVRAGDRNVFLVLQQF